MPAILPLFRAVALGVLISAMPLVAQSPTASPPLPADHWAHEALERLADAGLLHGVWASGMRPVQASTAGAALDSAAARSPADSPAGRFARSVAQRFDEERGRRSGAGAAWSLRAGPSLGPRAELAGVELGGRLAVAPSRHVAIMIAPSLLRDPHGDWSGTLSSGAVSAAAGGVQVDLARAGWRLGPGQAGLLLHEAVALDALTVRTASPRRLPGFLDALGPTDAAVVVTRIQGVTADTSKHPWRLEPTGSDAWMIASRISIAPHPRVRLGVNRVITGVTRWQGEGLGVADALSIAIGKHTAFDDQKASIDALVRVDPFGLPVSAYAVLGFEDSAGAIAEDPGLLLGIHVPHLPGLSFASARWEYSAFGEGACYAGDCDEAHNWFRHVTSGRVHASPDGVPLGHPLGGYGSEHRLEGSLWLDDARIRLRGIGLLQHRESANLLFEHGGPENRVLVLTAEWQPLPAWTLDLGFTTDSELAHDRRILDMAIRYYGGRF